MIFKRYFSRYFLRSLNKNIIFLSEIWDRIQKNMTRLTLKNIKDTERILGRKKASFDTIIKKEKDIKVRLDKIRKYERISRKKGITK